MKTKFAIIFFLLITPLVLGADKGATIPQSLLDAIQKVEQDRQDGIVADTEITIAQQAMDKATKDKATATLNMTTDQAAFLKLWAEIYGSTPPPPSTPTITTQSLTDGTVGVAYSQTMIADGGTPPYQWKITAGNFPYGISLNTSGLISGTPTIAGTYSMTFQVADAKAMTATKILGITVAATPPPPPQPTEKPQVMVTYDPKANVYQSDDPKIVPLTEPQRQVLFSTNPGSTRDWCYTHCITNSIGEPQFRVFPTNVSVDEAGPNWSQLVTAASQIPGIYVQRGTQIDKLPFPADNTSAIATLQKLIAPTREQLKTPLIIDDSNYKQFIGVHSTGYIRGPPPKGMTKFRDVFPLIPRSQWSQLIKDGKGTFLSDLMKAAKLECYDQDGTNYCWINASTECIEVDRALQGQPYIRLSPESAGGRITNWRNVGGNGLDALTFLQQYGACAASFMDAPNSLKPSRWKSGWEADALNHRITAANASIDDGDFDAVMTALFLRMPVSIGLDWWSHQVLVCDPVEISSGKFGGYFRNSWGSSYGEDGYAVLAESKLTPSGSFACISVSASDREINQNNYGTTADLARIRQATIKRLIESKPSVN